MLDVPVAAWFGPVGAAVGLTPALCDDTSHLLKPRVRHDSISKQTVAPGRHI